MSKVILINQNLSGGLGNDLVNWSLLFRSNGMDCTVVTWKDEGAFKDRLPPGVDKRVLGTKSFLKASLRLSRILREHPDAVILATQYKAGASAILARKIARTKQRVVYREPVLPTSYLNAYTIFRYYKLGLRHVDAVLAQTPHAAHELAALGIPEGIISVCPNLPPATKTIPSPPDTYRGTAPRIVTVGRLTRQKGLERLIRAFPLIRGRHPGASLTIVGDGESREGLEKLAAQTPQPSAIRFAGAVPDPTPFLLETDLFVMTSVYEGLSNAFVEALFAGCRVITTPAGGGMADFMKDLGAVDGIIDESDFEHDLLRAIDRAFAKRTTEWEPVFEKLAEKYSYEAVAALFLKSVGHKPPA